MANTYTQIYIPVVFAVQNRYSIISPHWKDDLYKYITGIININNQEKHHHKKTFREEFTEFLKELDIDYDEKYLFFSEK